MNEWRDLGRWVGDVPKLLNAALEGRYRIERQLGEGGMATVYLAADLRHERKVALKVLKPELTAVVGADRFLAEIKTTANLQHPHILPLFDSGEADSFLFYVMPYVEGESLRERLDREHQLPVDEAVQIAKNVAEALDYAHRHGVIHRDIKPANILLQDGKPVVSDFGIALAVSAGGANRLTETGLSLGTPHYMSPEQATGDLSVGAATDVYALGCVLYEMLVGEPPFTGSTPQSVLGKIVTGEAPSASADRRSVPPNVDAAIRKALEKVPADRFGAGAEFTHALADAGFRHGQPQRDVSTRQGPRGVAAGLVTLMALAAAFALGRASSASSTAPRDAVRLHMALSDDASVSLGGVEDGTWGLPSSRSLDFAPGGDMVAYSGWVESDGAPVSLIYLRRLAREQPEPLSGTEGGSSPFFSPDGAWLGFHSRSSLRRLSLSDGRIEVIARGVEIGTGLRGVTWGEDGKIVFGTGEGIFEVSSDGGSPRLLVAPSAPDEFFAQPQVLPGGRTVLLHRAVIRDEAAAEIVTLDLGSGTQATLLTDAMDPRYVDTGHLMFTRRGTLMAVPFDAERVELTGQPVTVLEGVAQALETPNLQWATGATQLAVSSAGHIAYASGGVYGGRSQVLVQLAVGGELEAIDLPEQEFGPVRRSPQGDRIAYRSGPRTDRGIYVLDQARGISDRVDPRGRESIHLAWSPDGRSLAVSLDSERPEDPPNIFHIPLDVRTEPVHLAPAAEPQYVSSWSSLNVIAYLQGPPTDRDIWILPPNGRPEPFVATPATEQWADFSPDGRWLAYASNRTGAFEVYVRAYPGPGGEVRISLDGGQSPAWSRDGRRLFYLSRQNEEAERKLMVVERTSEDTFGRPQVLLDRWPLNVFTPVRGYDVLDGDRFVGAVNQDALGENPSTSTLLGRRRSNAVREIHVVLNFFDELRQRVPAD